MSKDIIANSAKFGVNPQKAIFAPITGVVLATHEDPNNIVNFAAAQATNDVLGPTWASVKLRGVIGVPLDVQDGDNVFNFQGWGYSGGTIFENATIRCQIDGAFVSGQRPPMRVTIFTGPANSGDLERICVFSSGAVTIGRQKILRPVSEQLGFLNVGADVSMSAYFEQATGDANGPSHIFSKTRGTLAAPADVVDADSLGLIQSQGRSTTTFSMAKIQFVVDGTVTAAQRPPSRIDFYSNAANGSVTRFASLRTTGSWTWGTDACNLSDTALAATYTGHLFGMDGIGRHVNIARSANITTGPSIIFSRMRGTSLATPSNVTSGDEIFTIESRSYSGATGLWDTASIEALVDAAVVDNQRPASRFDFYTNKVNAAVTLRLRINNAGNFGFNTTSYGASSEGVLAVGNAAVIPTGNPTAGGVLYAEAGAGKWRGSGGTITTFGAADPHCPACGRDFAMEWEHDGQKFAPEYFAVCLHCLIGDLEKERGPRPYVMRAKVTSDVNEKAEVPVRAEGNQGD